MQRPTIEELEKILDAPEGTYEIEMLPSGEIRAVATDLQAEVDRLRNIEKCARELLERGVTVRMGDSAPLVALGKALEANAIRSEAKK